MANRTVLGAFDGTYVLRTSRPGYDVLNTGLAAKELAFDSRWGSAANILASGITRMTLVTGDLVGYTYCNISLPAGLSRVPVVRALIRHDTQTDLFSHTTKSMITGYGYNSGTGVFQIQGHQPWSLPPGAYNGMPMDYCFWWAMRQ